MKKFIILSLILLVLALPGCKKSSDVPVTPPGPEPPPPPTPLTEQLIGKMYYHDWGPSSEFDIYEAELYIVPKSTSAAEEQKRTISNSRISLAQLSSGKHSVVNEGIHKLRYVEVKGKLHERVVFKTTDSIDISKYDFEVRNVENLTNSTSDDFAVNINNNNQICFVTAPDGLRGNSNQQIAYMDLDTKVKTQLTPINGKHGVRNFDPDWKTDEIIIWSSDAKFHEVNINDLQVSESLLPEVDTRIYDPKYSPDRTKILFNTKQYGKKNSYLKDLSNNQIDTVLPADYFVAYEDDNPTWVFSNTLLTGHVVIDSMGRVYTRDIESGDFLIITDGSRDMKYVTPIMIENDVYLLFSDWTDKSAISLWISNHNGTVLRELNQSGDEVIFNALGLGTPQNKEELYDIAQRYVQQFDY